MEESNQQPESSSPPTSPKQDTENEKSMTQDAVTVSGLILASRILGVFREALLAAIFHLSWVLDAFVLAYQIPNLFRKLFGEGALSSAFIPVYTHYLENESREESNRFASNILTLLALILLVITVFGMTAAYFLPELMHLSDHANWTQLFTNLLMVLFPYTLIICLVAILGGMLNAENHFVAPAAAPVLLNICLVTTLLFLVFQYGTNPTNPSRLTYILAAVILLGGLLQMLLQIPPLHNRNVQYTFSVNISHPGVQKVGKLMIPSVVGLSVLQLNLLLDSWIAKWLVPEPGAIAALWFGNRIMQFPLALIGVALAKAAFPRLSQDAAQGNTDQLSTELQQAIQLALFLSVPASVGLLLLAEPTVQLLYEYGSFSADDTLRTSRVLFYYSLGIWSFCIYHLLTRAFYAVKDTKTPSLTACIMVIFNILCNIGLVLWTRSEIGIALSTSLTSFMNITVLSIILYRRFPPFSIRPLTNCLIRCTALSLIMAVPVLGTIEILAFPETEALLPTIGLRMGGLLLAVLPGMITYLGLSYLLNTHEMQLFTDQLRNYLQ